MAFSLRIGSALVTADTAAEAAELVRALGEVPTPQLAVVAPPATILIPPPAAAAPAPLPTAEAPADPKRKFPIGRGSIFKQEDRFTLEISIDGHSERRGSFKAREDAERAQEETYQARLRGDPLPIYVKRRCRRCWVVGHTAVKCQAPEAIPEPAHALPPAVPIPPPTVAPARRASRGSRGSIQERGGYFQFTYWRGKNIYGGSFATLAEAEAAQAAYLEAVARGQEPPPAPRRRGLTDGTTPLSGLNKDGMRAAMRAGWAKRRERLAAERGPAAPPPAPASQPPVRKGSPEYRARVAEGVRASWDRRRAAAKLAPAALAVPTQRPPVCVRCFRVGHVEADCQKQVIGPFRQTDPSCLTEQESEQLLDDDEGTDLTDLVDVPDAEPTVFADLNLNVECHACGRRGHIMSSPDCPLTTTDTGPEPERNRAEPRAPMPAARTETLLRMRRHLAVIDDADADAEAGPVDEQRPRTRGDCEGQPRPCPWAGCRYHLALDVLETGNLHLTFGDLDVSEMRETCSLDVADRGGATLEEVGRLLNVSRERIRQIETLAVAAAARSAKRLRIAPEFAPDRQSNAPEDTL